MVQLHYLHPFSMKPTPEQLAKAKHDLLLIYLGMKDDLFTEADVDIFSALNKDQVLQIKVDILKGKKSDDRN